MERIFAIASLFILYGCTALTDALVPPYVPEPIHIFDQSAYDADAANAEPQVFQIPLLNRQRDGPHSDGRDHKHLSHPDLSIGSTLLRSGRGDGATSDGSTSLSGLRAHVSQNCLLDSVRRTHRNLDGAVPVTQQERIQ